DPSCSPPPAPPRPSPLSLHDALPILTRNDGDSMTIDFLPPADLRGARTWAIDEPTIIAMYMNNRAVESLTSGRMDDAYWWARERSEEHTSELQSRFDLVCRLLLEKKK